MQSHHLRRERSQVLNPTQFDRLTQGFGASRSRRDALGALLGACGLWLLSVAMTGDSALAFKTVSGCQKHCQRHEGGCRNDCNKCCKKVVTGTKARCDFECGSIHRK
jgi:hypothetical protein